VNPAKFLNEEVTMQNEETSQTVGEAHAAATQAPDDTRQPSPTLTGRSIFAVETVSGGVMVRPAFLSAENGVMIAGSAVFPNLSYALQQIDALRQIVEHHFNKAAAVGSHVVAQGTAVSEAARV
jgi:hypothetical protein